MSDAAVSGGVFETVVPFRGVEVRGEATVTSCEVSDIRSSIAGRYLGREAEEADAGDGAVVGRRLGRLDAMALEQVGPAQGGDYPFGVATEIADDRINLAQGHA